MRTRKLLTRYLKTVASNQLHNPATDSILVNVRYGTERRPFDENLRLAKEKAQIDVREIERSNLAIRLKNRELRKLNEEQNERLQMVTHDLKNPLYNLRHEAEALQQNPDQAPVHTQRILQCADKMLELVNNFLSVQAIESGRLFLQVEPLDAQAQIARVLTSYQQALRRKQLVVKLDQPSNAVQLVADEQALTQVFDNLLSNAVKYSPAGGTIRVSLTETGDTVTIRVQDEGKGIPLSEVDRLFEKFTRLSTKPTGGEGSNGLGLFIAKKLVQLQQGDIWYEHHPGKGATFAVELPACSIA